MKLNGWQRLWLVATVLWSLFWLLLTAEGFGEEGYLLLIFYLCFIPTFTVYVAGWTIGWALRGFKDQ